MIKDRIERTRSDSYLGNANVKRDGVNIPFGKDQVNEYIRCSQDPKYFIEEYVKIINLDKGLIPFVMYPYQEKIIDHFNDNRHSILLSSRQSGKSITTCAFILWYAMFNSDRLIAIVANKESTAIEILERITLMLENMPFWIQPGTKELNKKSLSFSNNSKIFAAATSSSSIRGKSCVSSDTHVCISTNQEQYFYSSIDNFITTTDCNSSFSSSLITDCNPITDSVQSSLITDSAITDINNYVNHQGTYCNFDSHTDLLNDYYYLVTFELITGCAEPDHQVSFRTFDNFFDQKFRPEGKKLIFSDGYLGQGKEIKKLIEKSNPDDLYQRLISVTLVHRNKIDPSTMIPSGTITPHEILSQNGQFRRFDGFGYMGHRSVDIMDFDGCMALKCTSDHRFLRDDGSWIKSGNIKVGESYNGHVFKSRRPIHEPIAVYDAINVDETNSFYANGLIAHNCSLVYIDEFAFVNDAETFYTSTYPTIVSGETTKVIITSTPNGVGNMFHKIWEGANSGSNSYKPIRVDWWDVPGRDEEWKRKIISDTSELQFRQEFGNTFLGTSNTLIDTNTLMGLKTEIPVFENNEGTIRVYEKPIPDHDYIITVDVAKGRGQDFSTFNVIDITDSSQFKQVAVYQSSIISPILFPNIIYKYGNLYNEALIIVESNDSGQVVCNALHYELEYENLYAESMIKRNAIGVNMNRKVKRIGCSILKDLVENNRIKIVDNATIREMASFTARGGSFAASGRNHDDLVMNFVLFAWFTGTTLFEEIAETNLKEILYKDKIAEIDNDLLPFGFIDTGDDWNEDHHAAMSLASEKRSNDEDDDDAWPRSDGRRYPKKEKIMNL